MARTHRIFIASVAVVLGGCVGYEARELSPAATQARYEARRLDDAGLRQFLRDQAMPADGAWDLSRLTLAAFYFNPELALARARVAAAEAEVMTAAERPNPGFTFTPGRSLESAAGVTPWILSYALQLPLEIAGQRGHRITVARTQAEAVRYTLAAQAWAVHHAVRQALTEVAAAEAEAALWQRQQPLLHRAVTLVEAQVQAGEASALEAARARTALARATLALHESEQAAVIARSRLAEATGVPAAALAGVSLVVPAAATPVPDAAISRTWAAQNRADLLALLATYAAAQAALHEAIARQYPNLGLGPGYQLDQGTGKWSLALDVTLPVFHHHEGPVAAAAARREAAGAHFIAAQSRVLAEVDRTLDAYAAAAADLATAASLRRELERQSAMVRARQIAGEMSGLDLVRVEIELAEQARTELAVRVRADRALGALEDAVQRPLAWPDRVWRQESPNLPTP